MLRANGKNIYFTKHALIRMDQRGVTQQNIQRGPNSHHTVTPGQDDITHYTASINSRELIIVVEEKKKFYRIVSTFWR